MNKSSLFFIDKKRNEYSFDEFPEAVYIDTSFWIEVFGGNNGEYSRDCRNFLQDCLANEVILVTSNRVKGEIEINKKRAWVKEVTSKNPNLIVRYNNGNINAKATFENIVSNDELYNQFLDLIDADMKVIDKMCIMAEYVSDEEFWEHMLNVKKSTKYIIEDKDAEHVTIALKNGVNSIATRDGDYFATDNLNIFTVPTDKNKNEALGRSNIFNEFNDDIFKK